MEVNTVSTKRGPETSRLYASICLAPSGGLFIAPVPILPNLNVALLSPRLFIIKLFYPM